MTDFFAPLASVPVGSAVDPQSLTLNPETDLCHEYFFAGPIQAEVLFFQEL